PARRRWRRKSCATRRRRSSSRTIGASSEMSAHGFSRSRTGAFTKWTGPRHSSRGWRPAERLRSSDPAGEGADEPAGVEIELGATFVAAEQAVDELGAESLALRRLDLGASGLLPLEGDVSVAGLPG